METVETKEIKIRRLTVADRKRLSTLIDKLAETVGDNSLLNMISSTVTNNSQSSPENGEKNGENTSEEEKEENFIQIGVKILQALVQKLEEETHEWFSELIGVSQEEFLSLPFDTELKIIDQMVNAQESSSFFTIASGLYKKMQSLQDKFFEARKKSNLKADTPK
jgi:hypothetical protein